MTHKSIPNLQSNFTLMQNYFFDFVAPTLGHAELKVMLFIFRRTQGFNKDKDHISMSQFIDGIKDKDGNVLCLGTGLKKSSVVRALKNLEDKNLIIQSIIGKPGFQKRMIFLNTENNKEMITKLNHVTKIIKDQYHKDTGIVKIPPPYRKDPHKKKTYKIQ